MADEDEDRADARLSAAGDHDAFERIVVRWHRRIFNLAWRYSRDRATAEDIAQDVFVKVFRAIGTFRGESMFSTWITSVALNTCRSRARFIPVAPALFDLTQTPDSGPGTLTTLSEAERADSVRRKVLTLPELYRDAIILFYFEENDLAATAAILGVAEGTVKARLHRARELLRQRCSDLETT